MTDPVRTRCSSQALMPGGQQWKSCHRDAGHTEKEPHVWMEAFNVADRAPILVTWFGPRATEPTVSTVLPQSGCPAASGTGYKHISDGDLEELMAAAAELERWRSGQRVKGLRQVESVPDGLQYAAALVRAQGTEGGEDHDTLLAEAGVRLRDLADAARHLLAEAVALRAENAGLREALIATEADVERYKADADRSWGLLVTGRAAAHANTSPRVPPRSLDITALTDDPLDPTDAIQYCVNDGGVRHVYGDQEWVVSGQAVIDAHPGGHVEHRTITITYGEWTTTNPGETP